MFYYFLVLLDSEKPGLFRVKLNISISSTDHIWSAFVMSLNTYTVQQGKTIFFCFNDSPASIQDETAL